MNISENALELLQILHTQNVTVSVVEKRTKWIKSAFENAKQELLREGLVSGEGVITLIGKGRVKEKITQKEFMVNMNAFNTKWG